MDQLAFKSAINEKIPNMGCHLILDFNDVDTNNVDMNDYSYMHEFLTRIIIQSGGTIEGHQYKKFEPQGLTILYLLSESHFSIHTWPEFGACAIDFYHCGETARIRLMKAEELICDEFGWDKCTSSLLLDRGLRRKHQLNSYNDQSTIFSNLKLIQREKTQFQDIRIYQSKYYGMIISLNNMIQVVSNQSFKGFNSVLCDPVFDSREDDLQNQSIMIIGGGDLTVASYILEKYANLKQLTVVEIDEKVHDYSKKYILNEDQQKIINEALENKKLIIIFQDGLELINQIINSEQESQIQKFDGLIIDCADMIQQHDFQSQFMSLNFYLSAKKILNPNSMIAHMLSSLQYKKQFQTLLEQAEYRQIQFKTAFQPEFSMPIPIGYGIRP